MGLVVEGEGEDSAEEECSECVADEEQVAAINSGKARAKESASEDGCKYIEHGCNSNKKCRTMAAIGVCYERCALDSLLSIGCVYGRCVPDRQ